MELKEQILKALGLSSEVKFEVQAKLVDGTIIVSTADALAEGVDISVLTEDGTTIELPIGEYETEDGITFVVEEAGIIASIGEAEVVEEEEEEEEAPAEEEVVEAAEEVEAKEEEETSKYEALEKRIEYLESVIEEMKGGAEGEEELSEETTEVETTEPSENPRTVTTKTTEVVEFSVEELKAENEKLKEELAKKPADTSLNTNKFSSEKRTLSKQDLRRMTSQEKYLYNLYNN